jgi:quinoprotein glucose dehydrogenase
MHYARRNLALIIAVVLAAIFGIALIIGGGMLIALGGSLYYFVAGLFFAAVSVLLYKRKPAALALYALLVFGTLIWSLWEVGLDWWPLAARGDILFLMGLFLLTPWIMRALRSDPHVSAQQVRPYSAIIFDRPALSLALVLGLFLVVAIVSGFAKPHRLNGALPTASIHGAVSSNAIPAGEWPAYGRTGSGQRYSPLRQITSRNVANLAPAWHYHTGDVRGRPGDPPETTFEVTPLEIGNKVFLCTPHQSVIALDATTGKELWRYDPKIQGALALQHLTCRGLSYHAATKPDGKEIAAGAGVAAQPDSGRVASASEPSLKPADDPGLPVAAVSAKTAPDCPAKLFMPTADGRVIALNPENGEVCKDFGNGAGQIDLWTNMPNIDPGSYYSTSPVVVTRSLLVVGGTVLDNVSTHEPSGVIRAYDVDTGKLKWNWDSGRPDATAPLPAGQTFVANSPNSWAAGSVDEKLGLVYFPLGNQPPDQWGGNRSKSVEHFSSSIVALDLATGKVRWDFQTVHHDLWDYDVPAQPSLVDLTINGQTVPALVAPTKQGEIYVLDRRTGKPLLPVTERPVPQGAAKGDRTSPTQPVSELSYKPRPLTGADMWGATMFDQLACRIAFKKLRYHGRFTAPSTQGTLVYPGNFGVFNWGGIAVDPRREVAFTTPTYLAFVSKLVPRKNDKTLYVQGKHIPQGSLPDLNENFGAPFAVKLAPFTSILGLPCQAPPWGYVAGANLDTGKIMWEHKNGTVVDSSPVPLPFKMGVPNLGGPIMTAGGVAFLSGTLDDYIRAYDVTTGNQLWQSRLPAGGQATPMTYTGADGRQFVLVVAGGHGSLRTKPGDDVIAYALPPKAR